VRKDKDAVLLFDEAWILLFLDTATISLMVDEGL
jgi:hypothetical protein